MEKQLFGPMEADALGEMMNISLGSSATAISNMLDHRVDITTPRVTVVEINNFAFENLEPAMGVEVKYVDGLHGSNLLLLRRSDIKVIVDILMGSETPEEEFELDELTVSAVCEVMNQMMGAAATAMSDFLGFPVNISTPEPFELNDVEAFREKHLPHDSDVVVVVSFSLKIEDALESEFMNVMSVTLAKELLRGFGLDENDEANQGPLPGAQPAAPAPEPAPAPAPAPEPASEGSSRQLSQEEIEKVIAEMTGSAAPGQMQPAAEAPAAPQQPAPQPAPAAAPQAQQPPVQQPAAQQPPMQPPPVQQPPMQPPAGYPPMEGNPYGYMGYPPMYYPGYPYPTQPPAEPKVIAAKPVPMQEIEGIPGLGKEQSENLELIMEVPLQVTVEIGRAKRKVQDILEFSKGSLVVLDKLAGDQVDLFVNGKCIAKGDVVVIDDNFGVRITEIVQKSELDVLKPQK